MGQAGAPAAGAAVGETALHTAAWSPWARTGALPESLARPGQSSALPGLSQPAQQQGQPGGAAGAPGFGEGMNRGHIQTSCSGKARAARERAW